MSKFDNQIGPKKWPLRHKPPRQKDPREQERYCHISFFDGWRMVALENILENRTRRSNPNIDIFPLL